MLEGDAEVSIAPDEGHPDDHIEVPWGLPHGSGELPKEMMEESTMEVINPGNLMKMNEEEKE
eukprot:8148767-Prorocentrum_lima.AAC.1